MTCEYHPAERKLLTYFIPEFDEIIKMTSAWPFQMYRIASEEAFLYPSRYMQNDYIFALRASCIHLNAGKYRDAEFNKMITDLIGE